MKDMQFYQLPEWDYIDGFEIQIVGELIPSEDEDWKPFCTVLDKDVLLDSYLDDLNEVFWSVYQHYDYTKHPEKFAGTMCLADFRTKKEAEEYYNYLTKELQKKWDTQQISKDVSS